MRFFDAHCDTIGKIWEGKADFSRAGAQTADGGARGDHPGGDALHVTLPGLRAAGVCAQVFASWAWTDSTRAASSRRAWVRSRRCGSCATSTRTTSSWRSPGPRWPRPVRPRGAGRSATAAPTPLGAHTPRRRGGRPAPIAAIASLEGADPLVGEVDNLAVFFQAGVRLITSRVARQPLLRLDVRRAGPV